MAKTRAKVLLELQPMEAMAIMGAMQFTLRNLPPGSPTGAIAAAIANRVTEGLKEIHPSLELLAEMGWHTEYDDDTAQSVIIMREIEDDGVELFWKEE